MLTKAVNQSKLQSIHMTLTGISML